MSYQPAEFNAYRTQFSLFSEMSRQDALVEDYSSDSSLDSSIEDEGIISEDEEIEFQDPEGPELAPEEVVVVRPNIKDLPPIPRRVPFANALDEVPAPPQVSFLASLTGN